MKQNFIMALLCLIISQANAQPKEFLIYITDKSQITAVNKSGGTVTPVFVDANINTIISNYTVTGFAKAFPTSNYNYMLNVYKIQCDSVGLAYELKGYDSILFPRFEVLDTITYLSYQPNDYTNYNTGWLDYINMKDAWDNTNGSKGSSSIVIGVIDNFFDVSHPDLINKLAFIGTTAAGPGYITHGTQVAGIVAAETDNGIGLPGVGFNCQMDITTSYGGAGDSSVLAQSQRKRSIINASWTNKILSAYPPSSQAFVLQGLYNEVYENGTLVVCAAGDNHGDPRQYCFPASYDHNFSVTSVGWEHNLPTTFNVKDVHEINVGDSAGAYQHNDYVDLCAPGVRISALNYDPANPSVKYLNDAGWGSSMSAPMVSGTVGLMLAKLPWLSPYQLEYLLKTTAKNIYTNTYNTKYAGTNQYNGRLGAGALDAGAAVNAIRDFNADNPASKTFVIKGIDLNTKCAPNVYAGVPKPKIKVLLANGVPPYRFKWEPMPDNNVFLGIALSPDSPIVNGSFGTHLLHYRLTIYDASPIQKVANAMIKVQLRTDSTWDLAMRDAYADTYNERNDMEILNSRDWNIWESPDVWNRQYQDDSLNHINPEYFSAAPNYLYTRIKNVGCATSPSSDSIRLKLYWTIASTGETWKKDWDGTTTLNGHPGGAEINPSGLQIPSIKSGEQTILSHDWTPPEPQLYDTITKIDVCVLARIETSKNPIFGMAFVEDTLTKENVWNNNNIVTRNMIVNNLNTSNKTSITNGVFIGNSGPSPDTFTVEVLTDKHVNPHYGGNLGGHLTVTLALNDLYDVWDAGGKQGNAISYNNTAKTVTYDLAKPLRLENIILTGNERHWIHVTFDMKPDHSMPFAVNDQYVYVRQLKKKHSALDIGDGTSISVVKDDVYGAVCYQINIESDSVHGAKQPSKVNDIKQSRLFNLYPNPTKGMLTISINNSADKDVVYKVTVVDIAGKTVYKSDNAKFNNKECQINTSKLISGSYFVKISDNKNRHEVIKFIKVD